MVINNSDLMLVFTVASSAVAFLCLCLSVYLFSKIRKYSKTSSSQNADFEIKLTKLRQEIESLSRKDIEQAGKIAWLESRIRFGASNPNISSSLTSESSFEENLAVASAATVSPKLSLVERRHKIISLAKRGIDVTTISEMLSIPQGEVELIIGLGLSKIA